jgi:hypothetical protein
MAQTRGAIAGQIRGGHAYWPTIRACRTRGLVRGSKLAGGCSVSRGGSRADPDARQAARMALPARGRGPKSRLGGATARRPAGPVLRFRPGGPPAARGRRPCDRAGRERPSTRRVRFAPQTHQTRGGHAYRPTIFERGTEGPVRRIKLVDGPAVSCGCRRADPDVRRAARLMMPARGRVANRCQAPLPAAGPNRTCRRRPESRPLRGRLRRCDCGPRTSIRWQ